MNSWSNHFQWWLIDFQVAATLLLTGTLIGVRLLRQPAQRVALTWVASAGLAFLCVAAAVPAWPRLQAVFRTLEHSSPGKSRGVLATAASHEASGASEGGVMAQNGGATKSAPSAAVPYSRPRQMASAFRVPRFGPPAAGLLLSRLFLLGSAAMCLWLVLGMIEAVWLCRTARPAPAELNEELLAVAREARPLPRLLLSFRVRNAVALGIVRPTILLPATLAAQADEGSLRAVLAHEWAHIRNRDLWLLGLMRGLLIMLFPNPLYWALRQAARDSQEAVADAVAAQTRGGDYADGLIAWMRRVSTPRCVIAAPTVGIWEKPSELSKRIAMLIDEELTVQTSVSGRWRTGAVVLVSGAVVGLSLLTVRPVSARQTGQAQSSSATVQPAVSPVTEAQERVYKQAGALAAAGNLAQAEEQLNNLLAHTEGPAAQILKLRSLQLRGDVRARMGRFQEAVSDLELAVQTDPDDHNPWFKLTMLLAQTGDVAKYRARCKEMVHRFIDTTDAATATQLAKSCLVMPSALDAEDVVLAERLADAAVALTPPGQFFPWRGMTMGLAEYRRGELARANEIVDSVGPALGEGNGWSACGADVFFISAMTHQQLKETDKARAAYDQGRELVRSKLPALDSKDLHPDWWDVLFANMLMSEAGKSIDGAKPSQP